MVFSPRFGSFYFYSFYLCFALLLPECPEILDDGSKREEADGFWKRLDGLLWWGAAIVQPALPSLALICYIRELSTVIWRTAELKWCFVAPCCPTQEIPQQSNENDCGVFVLEVQTSALHSWFFFFLTHLSCPHPKMPLSQYSRCLTLGKPLNFSQRDIPKIRKRIYKELCDCKIHLQDWRGVVLNVKTDSILTLAHVRVHVPMIIISDQWWTQPYLLNFLLKWTCFIGLKHPIRARASFISASALILSADFGPAYFVCIELSFVWERISFCDINFKGFTTFIFFPTLWHRLHTVNFSFPE